MSGAGIRVHTKISKAFELIATFDRRIRERWLEFGLGERLAQAGEQKATAFIEVARQVFSTQPAVRIDYIALVDWATLEPVEEIVPGSLFAVAAFVGTTRLIDNFVF